MPEAVEVADIANELAARVAGRGPVVLLVAPRFQGTQPPRAGGRPEGVFHYRKSGSVGDFRIGTPSGSGAQVEHRVVPVADDSPVDGTVIEHDGALDENGELDAGVHTLDPAVVQTAAILPRAAAGLHAGGGGPRSLIRPTASVRGTTGYAGQSLRSART